MNNDFYKKLNIEESIFPEESQLIIEKIVEKHDLMTRQNNAAEMLIKVKGGKEQIEIFNNLPGNKIARLVADYSQKKISIEQLPELISKELKVDKMKGKEISKDLKENLLIFVKQVPCKEIVKRKPKINIIKYNKKSLGEDQYRESIK